MKFNLKDVEFSRNDLKSNISIPCHLTLELAEFIGIMVGDGHLGYYQSKSSNKYSHKHYEMEISGNIKDHNYYQNFVNPLIQKVFNVPFNIALQQTKNSIRLRKNSKGIFTFLHKTIGIPQTKDQVEVPNCILKANKKMKAAFLRGLADADFCLTIRKNGYPRVQGASKSEKLILQVAELLKQLNIQSNKQIESTPPNNDGKRFVSHRLYISGHSRVKNYLDEIGFSNSKKVEKYNQSISSTEDLNKIYK